MATAAATRDADKVLHGIANMYHAEAEVYANEAAMHTALDDVDYDGDWGSDWTPFGYSEDGVATEKNTDTDDVRASESVTPLNVLVTGVNFIARITVIESTLEFMKVAFGGGTLSTTAAGAGQIGMKKLKLGTGLDRYAIGFEVENELGFWTKMYVPKVLSVATVGTDFKLNGIRAYPIEFRAICKPEEVVVWSKTANATS